MAVVFRSTTVVGAGAVGCYFGAKLAQAGHAVTLVARPAHVEAIRSRGLQLQTGGQTHTVPIGASTTLDAVAGADLVLVCVKSPDTAGIARAIAPLLAPQALVVSLQNGVDNAAVLAHHLSQTVVPAVVYVATAMGGPGLVQHFGRGDLVIGTPDGRAAVPGGTMAQQLQALVDLFVPAGVPVRVADDVLGELWRKLLVNCAWNAVSALAQQPYGRIAAVPALHETLLDTLREVVAVAGAAGHPIPLDEAIAAADRIPAAMPAQMASTAQDLARGKPSEIDHLNGYVARLGAQLGVPTPVNRALHALVKVVEATRSGAAPG